MFIHSCSPRMLPPLYPKVFSFSLFLLACIRSNIKTTIALNLTTLRFDGSYSPLFSDFNIKRSTDDKTVSLGLNRLSGSGIISTDYYHYGFYSASIKLPESHTAGIVVAFYTSNADTFEKNHDELDIEFLGNVEGGPWKFQTNVYGNGSVSRGREERYKLWFDPSKESHRFSILWTPNNVIFYVDDVPIREVVRNEAMGGDFPSKPMSVYATIWDASSWATDGGKYKVDYKYEPFVAELTDLVIEGCIVDPIEQIPSTNCSDRTIRLLQQPYATISPDGHLAMKNFRENFMYYSHCYDNVRYSVTPPECVIVPSERELFKGNGRIRGKIASQRKRRDQKGKQGRIRNTGSQQASAK
ncbi:hypothetical protein Leryth_015145 [Lithospermum erythrorhizon]|nr:hypothetical protein Leryth_015145 [Lithospermum erythrorhizon]